MSQPTVLIEDIKSIKRLKFEIPRGGVHVLSGANGAGKTTLMACLQRLAVSNAFQTHFKTSQDPGLDEFDGTITYSHGGRYVEYMYGGARWSPQPRSNADILKHFGFSSVSFIGATGERLYIQDRELNRRSIRPAEAELCSGLNELFDTQKYGELKQIKVGETRGRGGASRRRNKAFLLPTNTAGKQVVYYSERNFSLGEIMVLNLLDAIANLPGGSLLLIDEIELALHARVQVKLYDYLKRYANERDLTVLISTHSSSLINVADNLIYLEKDESGETQVLTDCYPAYILKAIGGEFDMHPDMVFLVEDDQAEALLRAMLDRYFAHTGMFPKPTLRVLPIGGYPELLRFGVKCRNGTLFPSSVKVVCFPDHDVDAVITGIRSKTSRSSAEQQQLDHYTGLGACCRFLPWTPERGLMDFLNAHAVNHRLPIGELFESDGSVDISRLVNEEASRPGITRSTNPRTDAKYRIGYITDRIADSTNLKGDAVRKRLYNYFVQETFSNAEIGRLQQFLAPILN